MFHRVLVLAWSLFFWDAVFGNSTEPYRLRLVNGQSRCRGELQVQRSGHDWTGVIPGFVPLLFGHRVCAQLDCGSALTVEKTSVEEREAVGLATGCEDPSLTQCFDHYTRRSHYSLELNCSDSVRLVSGRSLCSGSLQILDQSLSRSWTWVCEGALDRMGAEVLCRELGCGSPVLQGELSPLGQTFHCVGHESALMHCPRNQTRTNPKTCSRLSLTCSEPLRLVGGLSRCEGTVELKFRGEWRRVESLDRWDLEAAGRVCRGLDCGSALSTEERSFGRSEVWDLSPRCVKSKADVRDCVRAGPSPRFNGQTLKCSDSVRLVSGRSLCSGSLQILDQSLSRSWTWVCEGTLDRVGAEVLCRELGCGPPLLQGELSPLRQTFYCEGHESALMDCPRNQTRTNRETCSRLSLTCSEPLRLVGGASRCEGTVELKHEDRWRRMWTPFNPWSLEAAGAVCQGLDCGAPVSTEKTKRLKKSYVWAVSLDCVKKNSAARDCVYAGISGQKTGLRVNCSDSVRLVSGRGLCSGSLQILDQSLSRSWTWVCEGALDRVGAEVLCRELGCGPPLLQGELSPLRQTFYCEGHESALMDCPQNQTRTNPEKCSRLNLTCSELRLVRGSSRCEGIVELKFGGDWGRVVPSAHFPWDLEAAGVVCRALECGSAVSVKHRLGLRRSDVLVTTVDCVKRKSAVSDCVRGAFPGHEGLWVVCSGKV